jgi:hypothetical protein
MHPKVIAAAALLALVVGSGPAAAGPPANRACLGHDSSTTAQVLANSGSSLGEVVSGIATGEPAAIGDEVQAHLAGEIPDEVFANSCND